MSDMRTSHYHKNSPSTPRPRNRPFCAVYFWGVLSLRTCTCAFLPLPYVLKKRYLAIGARFRLNNMERGSCPIFMLQVLPLAGTSHLRWGWGLPIYYNWLYFRRECRQWCDWSDWSRNFHSSGNLAAMKLVDELIFHTKSSTFASTREISSCTAFGTSLVPDFTINSICPYHK